MQYGLKHSVFEENWFLACADQVVLSATLRLVRSSKKRALKDWVGDPGLISYLNTAAGYVPPLNIMMYKFFHCSRPLMTERSCQRGSVDKSFFSLIDTHLSVNK